MSGTQQRSLADLTEELHRRRHEVSDEARPDAVAQQRKYGKWTARERVDALVDEGTFVELGALARAGSSTGLMEGFETPSDGIVVGRAEVDGRPVVVVSYDFTVLGGSMGSVLDAKFAAARQVSLRHGIPLIMFVEGGGARINERMGSTTIRGHERFSDLCLLSGWAPILCGVVGPTYAGHANLVALSDFTVMVEGASLGLAGPRLVEAATGERIGLEDLGASVHANEIGSVELAVPDEQSMIDAFRRYLSYMPANASERPPVEPYEASGDERLGDEVLSLVPESLNRAYDMRRLVHLLADEGSVFELKPTFAQNLITAFARFGGHPVGVVANNPMFYAGVMDTPASDKMARFVNICDAFGIPVLVLSDVPGYMVGVAAERTNIARRSMRPLWEFGQATVPILTVVVRKAYGLAYHTMGGAEFHPVFLACWPSARVSPMGAEGAANVLLGKDPEATAEQKAELAAEFAALESPFVAAEAFKVDDVIDPRDTRALVIDSLEFVHRTGHTSGHWRPPKKRGIAPC